jgi:hypothetical protein
MNMNSIASPVRHAATVVTLVLLMAFVFTPAIAQEPKGVDPAELYQEQNIQAAEVQMAMYDMVKTIEMTLSLDSKASDKILNGDPAMWGMMNNKSQVLRAAQDFRKFRTSGLVSRQQPLSSTPPKLMTQFGTAAFEPNYPLPDVNYTVMLAFGMVTFPITSERTNPAGWLTGVLPPPYDQLGWTAYVSAVKSAGEALAIAQFACTVGTCFPLACAFVCGPVEIAAAAYQILSIPLKCADAWDAQIDSAEIQAAYENARIVLGDLAAEASALATHDAWVRAKMLEITGSGTALAENLAVHDAWVKAMLGTIVANQNEIIKLLKTPEGMRPGWKKEGYH